MEVPDLIGNAISSFPHGFAHPADVLKWCDDILRLAYAADDIELDHPELNVELKRAGLALHKEALSNLNHKNYLAFTDSCGTLNRQLTETAGTFRKVCGEVFPEILPYFDITVCT